jgi:hypothetical protein
VAGRAGPDHPGALPTHVLRSLCKEALPESAVKVNHATCQALGRIATVFQLHIAAVADKQACATRKTTGKRKAGADRAPQKLTPAEITAALKQRGFAHLPELGTAKRARVFASFASARVLDLRKNKLQAVPEEPQRRGP